VTFAYLDPGSGSLIASALVGGVAAAGVAAKQARMRLGTFGRKKKNADETSTQAVADETEATESAEATDAVEAPADESATVTSDT
jgi:hypothetical protein